MYVLLFLFLETGTLHCKPQNKIQVDSTRKKADTKKKKKHGKSKTEFKEKAV